MTAVSSRLSTDNQDWLQNFIDRTGAPQAKVVNEALRLAKPTLLKRLNAGEILFPPNKDQDYQS